MRDDLTRGKLRAARILALGADLVQIVLLPIFSQGVLSPANDVIDVIVAAILLRLLGWHWAFLPTFVAESVPFVDLVPTWTAAVFLATRHGVPAPPPEVVVDTPASRVETRSLPAPDDQSPPGRSGA